MFEVYNKVNNGFKKSCVFAVGHSSGFFSEINNMIFAMLYCLENEIKFIPYFKDANFSDSKGWEEFFVPFCNEFESKIGSSINLRYPKPCQNNVLFKIKVHFFKKKHKISYLTHEIWNDFYTDQIQSKQFDIKSVGVLGNIVEASGAIAKMIWRFNEPTKSEIEKIVKSLNLPDKYLAVHIRSGDKITESGKIGKLINSDMFMAQLSAKSNINEVYVFADDYRQIEKLRKNYPDYKFYTLCAEDERGYFNTEFQNLEWEEKRIKLLNLFANIEICRNAEMFFGSHQANPDFFVRLLIDPEKFSFVSGQ